MIDAYCRTNLDDYKREEWPTQFVAVPRIGERVQASSGNSLRICAITYFMMTKPFGSSSGDPARPAIIVELNK